MLLVRETVILQSVECNYFINTILEIAPLSEEGVVVGSSVANFDF